MRPRDALWLGLGALAVPLGGLIGWWLHHRNLNH